jgi:hypothetical protein
MAKKDLDLLAERINSIIASNKEFYREQVNKQTHIYKINGDILYAQVSKQLKRVKKYSGVKNFDEELRTICNTAAPKILEALVQYSGTKARCRMLPGSQDTIMVRARINDLDVFTFIRSTRRDRLIKYLRDPIVEKLFGSYNSSAKYSEFMKQDDAVLLGEKSNPSSVYSRKINQLDSALFGGFRRDKKGTPEERLTRDKKTGQAIRTGGFSHLGHLKDNAVSVRLQQLAVDQFLSSNDFIQQVFPNNQIVVEVVKSVSSFRNSLGDFSIRVKIIEEGAYANLNDASEEKKQLDNLGKSLKAKLLKDINWRGQKGSNSPIEQLSAIIVNDAINVFKSIPGAKVRGSKKKIDNGKNTGKSKSNLPKAQKARASRGSSSTPINIKESSSPKTEVTPNQPNWLRLLPVINSRLNDTVAKNMKEPRLNFRTGRFAQSARVVNVEQTPQGFPSFVFDYERDPYDVFDRTLGRSPWNTPQRDPRALVDLSVREIVREMAIGRFFTRRA